MTFATRLNSELSYQGKTWSDLARFLNVQLSTIKSWQYRNSTPAADTALKVAKYLNVSLEWLITGEESKAPDPQNHFSIEENELLNSWRVLTPEQQIAVKAVINSFATVTKKN